MGKRILTFEKSFASHPKSEFWVYELNNGIEPKDVCKSSSGIYCFRCAECKHIFEASLNGVTRKNGPRWCGYCGGKRLCSNDECEWCYDRSFASSNFSHQWSLKNKIEEKEKINFSHNEKWKSTDLDHELNPRQIRLSSGRKCWFKCDTCFHPFRSVLNGIKGCAYCANQMKCDDKCDTCFKQSFASSKYHNLWSSKNELSPRQVAIKSGKSFLFTCENQDCGHEYLSTPYDINRERRCNFCASKVLCDDPLCKMCLDKSFASHKKAKYWSDKNEITPRKVFKSSNEKFWFDCDTCCHDFEMSIFNITHGNNWCNFCAHKKLCDDVNCVSCHENSFASSDKAKHWSSKNELKSRQVFKASNSSHDFDCENCGNEFQKQLNFVSCKKRWCPKCTHKTELKLHNWLEDRFIVIAQKKFKTDLNLLIELDGRQHFEPVSKWVFNPEVDVEKNDLANDNGMNLIRICQRIVLFDKEDWEKQLLNAISEVNKKTCKLIKIGKVYV